MLFCFLGTQGIWAPVQGHREGERPPEEAGLLPYKEKGKQKMVRTARTAAVLKQLHSADAIALLLPLLVWEEEIRQAISVTV